MEGGGLGITKAVYSRCTYTRIVLAEFLKSNPVEGSIPKGLGLRGLRTLKHGLLLGYLTLKKTEV